MQVNVPLMNKTHMADTIQIRYFDLGGQRMGMAAD